MEEFTFSSKSGGKYNEKGSIFSALVFPVPNVTEVKNKKNADVIHICYGYRIKQGGRLDKFSTDTSEPKGSSGFLDRV